MLDLVLDRLGDAHFMAFLLAALGCAATALTVVVPMLQTDNLVAPHQSGLRRARAHPPARARTPRRQGQPDPLRSRPSSTLKRLVDTLNLTSWLSTETAKESWPKPASAARGRIRLRRRAAHRADRLRDIRRGLHLLHRRWQQPLAIKLGGVMAAVYLGVKAPEIYLRNATTKRQKSIERAYPNTLDLMLICANRACRSSTRCAR